MAGVKFICPQLAISLRLYPQMSQLAGTAAARKQWITANQPLQQVNTGGIDVVVRGTSAPTPQTGRLS